MDGVLLVGKESLGLTQIARFFKEMVLEVHIAETGSDAMSLLDQVEINLLITEETKPDIQAKRLIIKALEKNCMMNCAVISPRSKKEFHDHYEGYGVLCQLSDQQEIKPQLKKMLSKILKISNLHEGIQSIKGVAKR